MDHSGTGSQGRVSRGRSLTTRNGPSSQDKPSPKPETESPPASKSLHAPQRRPFVGSVVKVQPGGLANGIQAQFPLFQPKLGWPHAEPTAGRPLDTPPTIVQECLERLNDPDLSIPPRLPVHVLYSIYQRTKSKFAPEEPEDFKTLEYLKGRLAEEIFKAKVELQKKGRQGAQSEQLRPPDQRSSLEQQKFGYTTGNLILPSMPGPFGGSVLETFLRETNGILANRDGEKLQNYLQIEPPFNDVYAQLIEEVGRLYPKNNGEEEDALEAKVKTLVPETGDDSEGASWSLMAKFLVGYLTFIRDVDITNLLETYNQLSDLQQRANSALTSASRGIIILPTVIAYAKVFARLAIGLDKRPDLIAHLITTSADEDGSRETLPEKAANILRQAFVTCLNDRGTTATGIKDGKPDGKKVGIYKMANICLKILFQCDKKENGEQIFINIYNSSPPLSIYPASERVTYLYYLGRFHFATNHFFAAQMALQEAYDHSPADKSCQTQRRLILVYLIASNIILGRFPSQQLYSRPEAHGLKERFDPICVAIAKGHLENFRRLTSIEHPHAPWFLKYRILTQIENRCEVLIWRSLLRKIFLLTGDQGDNTTRKAATIDLRKASAAFALNEQRSHMSAGMSQVIGGAGQRPYGWWAADFTPKARVDPEFEGFENELYIYESPDILDMEAITASLIQQGFLQGYISHKMKRFAITGAKKIGPLKAGFPNVWETVRNRARNEGSGGVEECPGWKKDDPRKPGGVFGAGFGPGMVVNLSGARPVGANPFG